MAVVATQNQFPFQAGIVEKAEIVGTVRELAKQRHKRLGERFGVRGPVGHPETPLVREWNLHDGELPIFTGDVTHFVRDGNVWRLVETPDRFCAEIEQVVGRPPAGDWASFPMKVFYATIDIRLQVDWRTAALAQAGCTRVFRAWRQTETFIEGGDRKPCVYAEVAVFGAEKGETAREWERLERRQKNPREK